MSKLELVKTYCTLRAQCPQSAPQLMTMFTPKAKVKGADGSIYDTPESILAYLTQPSPVPTSIGDLEELPDGRILYRFSVVKFWMTFIVNAYFQFEPSGEAGHYLINYIEVVRP